MCTREGDTAICISAQQIDYNSIFLRSERRLVPGGWGRGRLGTSGEVGELGAAVEVGLRNVELGSRRNKRYDGTKSFNRLLAPAPLVRRHVLGDGDDRQMRSVQTRVK